MSRSVTHSFRGCVVASLVVVLVAGVGLAHASPPDPTWIAGLYDDADHDDVILLLLGLDAFVVTITFSPQPAGLVEPVIIPGLTHPPARCIEAVRSRAPPPTPPA